MTPLASEQRKIFERIVIAAREAAEKGAENALKVLAVDQPTPFSSLSPEHLKLREGLVALRRTLAAPDDSGFKPLVAEVAYEQWHRMLFARFLAENDLLIHPEHQVPVTLDDCDELAAGEGEPDRWMVAAKYASRMLPGIFKQNDPTLQIQLAVNDRQALEDLVMQIPTVVFLSDDGLGWAYQFWQTKAKQEVNKSGRKIGGRDLPAVTQLFTEHYMVRFLLENTLGAWWVARHPESPLRAEWEYLRFRDDGTPAAGTFTGWPELSREITVMDPCMGSGHFLVAAADMLRKMRMEEEGLSLLEAGEAVIRANLFGLELDARCTQIAAFALAFDAWKNAGGYRPLPLPNLACSGISVGPGVEEWRKLAGSDDKLRYALERLHALFRLAPELGSLINPADVPANERMFAADYDDVAPLLERALEQTGEDLTAAVFGAAAEGAARAGRLLAGRFTVVATNVPYLGGGKQEIPLRRYIEDKFPLGKQDLATAFLQRCREFASQKGTILLVTPENWLSQTSYESLRKELLRQSTFRMVVLLGEEAWQTFGNRGPRATLLVIDNFAPDRDNMFRGIDVSAQPGDPQVALAEKLPRLKEDPLVGVEQQLCSEIPGAVIKLGATRGSSFLLTYAQSFQGIKTGDDARFRRAFWEVKEVTPPWRLTQGSIGVSRDLFAGLSNICDFTNGGKYLARLQGLGAWHKDGIAVSLMRSLATAAYPREPFFSEVAAVVPKQPEYLLPLFAFASSGELRTAVRKVESNAAVSNATLGIVPFDLTRWQKEASHIYPDGLPEPHSDDPTQWLFIGSVVASHAPLQVSVARLLGYRWPEQAPAASPGIEALDAFLDDDGIVSLPPVAGERPNAERLRAILSAAHAHPPSGPRPRGASDWPMLPSDASTWIAQLLADAGTGGKTLEQWLRDDFFTQHCALFHNRPFIWQVWDGLRDGFSALLNYHRMDRQGLEKLIYHYLNAWIDTQANLHEAGEPGAENRLIAAQKLKQRLELILQGEPPYDIYVRWKTPAQQPLGWEPDLDDGVRLNIRPFMTAGVLRRNPNIKWGIDRGKNPDGSVRDNDVHLTLAEKRAARSEAGA